MPSRLSFFSIISSATETTYPNIDIVRVGREQTVYDRGGNEWHKYGIWTDKYGSTDERWVLKFNADYFRNRSMGLYMELMAKMDAIFGRDALKSWGTLPPSLQESISAKRKALQEAKEDILRAEWAEWLATETLPSRS